MGYLLLPNGTCRFLVYDFNNHVKDAEKNDFTNTDDTLIMAAPVFLHSVKVYELIKLLKEKQILGVEVTLVT